MWKYLPCLLRFDGEALKFVYQLLHAAFTRIARFHRLARFGQEEVCGSYECAYFNLFDLFSISRAKRTKKTWFGSIVYLLIKVSWFALFWMFFSSFVFPFSWSQRVRDPLTMGYDIDQFSSDVNDELVCSICTNVLMEPVQTQCDHLFCHACLHHWLRTSPSCPVDRHYLCNDMIKPAPRYIRNLINQLLIQCDYRSDGCKAEIMLEGYEQHVDNCVFNPNRVVTCKHAHCRKQMTVNQLNRHDCISELVHRNKELT